MLNIYQSGIPESSGIYTIPVLAPIYQNGNGHFMKIDQEFVKNRIEKRREELGLTREDVAGKMGVSDMTIFRKERGQGKNKRDISIEELPEFAAILQCSVSYLLGQDMGQPMVPVLSYVGAGAKVYAIDDHERGAGLDEVEPPTGYSADGIVALIVHGDSMEPQIEAGWLIFYRRESDGVPPDCIGELCVVMMQDDSVLVKKVRQGSKPGLFHLLSKNPNHEPIFDAKVRWASRVIDIRPK
jgi:phage repressor protein C with HTH and peptisase S24 domain